jgi:hypothetical protein
MIYSQLSPSYKYDILADAVYGREVEYFHYDFDRINFEHILKDLPECEYRTNLENRLADTIGTMAQVERTMAALLAQIDDPIAYAEGVARAIERREAAKLKEKT